MKNEEKLRNASPWLQASKKTVSINDVGRFNTDVFSPNFK
jgi:hypothetical protein